MTYSIDQANEFIKKAKIDTKFYPKINLAAPVGWINDPNGISIFNDEYHVFYQAYPYGTLHGPMHWGHAKTKDCVNWEHLPIALAPDQEYDKGGVFSGCGIEHEGDLVLLYTGNLPDVPESESRQVQNIAISSDGVNFEKYKQNPVIGTELIPEGTSKVDFRDPNIFVHEDLYYTVIGTKSTENIGQVAMYKSEDLINWEFVNIILEDYDYLGDMAECPDLMFFDEKAVMIVSAMNYVEDDVFYPHKTMLIEGEMDWKNYQFKPENKREMDFGFDYYAPQTAKEKDGSYFNIAWHQVWNKTLVTGVKSHGWSGQMTIPQTIYREGDKILRGIHPRVLEQQREIRTYTNVSTDNEIKLDGAQFIELKINKDECPDIRLVFKNDSEEIEINLNFHEKQGYFSRDKTKYPIENEDGTPYTEREFPLNLDDEEFTIQIIKDTSSIQVYINDYYSISNTYYTDQPLETLKITSTETGHIGKMNFAYLTEVE